MKLKNTKVLLVGEFDNRDTLEKRLEERGAIIAKHITRDIECVFVGTGDPVDADNAKEMGLRVSNYQDLEKALNAEEPTLPAFFEEEEIDLGEMPAYLNEGPPVDDSYMPSDEEGSDFSDAREVIRSKAKNSSKSPNPISDDADQAGEWNIERGTRVKIIGGKQGVGDVGEVFWLGENKYGPGIRAGVKTSDGKTYWVDTNDLGPTDSVVSESEIEAAKENSMFAKGDSVKIISGEGEGSNGTIFWWGESKFGPGMRAGVEAQDGEKYWVDAEHLEAL